MISFCNLRFVERGAKNALYGAALNDIALSKACLGLLGELQA